MKRKEHKPVEAVKSVTSDLGDNACDRVVVKSDELEQPKPIQSFMSFLISNGLQDCDQAQVLYQVFQDLRLIRKWTGLRVSQRASRPYLAGSAAAAFDSVYKDKDMDKGEDRTQVVVPVSAWEELSALDLQALCRECVHPETGEQLRCMTLAIVDDDSTTAYYRIFSTWEEIVHPQWKMKKKHKTEGGIGTEERDQNDVVEESESSSNSDSDS
ncbi:hypothetical protein BWQ96_00159 [Gracilariopsis chorda]|uniref:tRNA-splicing endonuclease subunit Sen15 domain-containing protein n=1 Tax=Gracilariopsis chorda TaxID=448386 RepID=A0A2V3J6H0_9FLOR|nr:hypothetical protein BWQ96_00159 [Gracilariopsis chorda]|eukprot:PXF49999.1 hypothetical protein BWQ96_00159 [Gracilariopsis chorda]